MPLIIGWSSQLPEHLTRDRVAALAVERVEQQLAVVENADRAERGARWRRRLLRILRQRPRDGRGFDRVRVAVVRDTPGQLLAIGNVPVVWLIGRPFVLMMRRPPATVTLYEAAGQLTEPCTWIFVFAFHVLFVVLIHGPTCRRAADRRERGLARVDVADLRCGRHVVVAERDRGVVDHARDATVALPAAPNDVHAAVNSSAPMTGRSRRRTIRDAVHPCRTSVRAIEHRPRVQDRELPGRFASCWNARVERRCRKSGRRCTAAIVPRPRHSSRTAANVNVFDAAALGDVARSASVLAADPSLVDAWSADGFTALHFAAYLGGAEVGSHVARRRRRSSAVARNDMRVQPLHSAAALGDVDACRALLDAGADPNAEQQGGFRPLDEALITENAPLAALLRERGARGVGQSAALDDPSRRARGSSAPSGPTL